MFHFVYADEDGNGYIDEDYFALGLLGAQFVEPTEEEVIPLPEGASLTPMIPNRTPVVINDEDQFVLYPGEGWVMGALLPQGYTRTLRRLLSTMMALSVCPCLVMPQYLPRMVNFMWQPHLPMKITNGIPSILTPMTWQSGWSSCKSNFPKIAC